MKISMSTVPGGLYFFMTLFSLLITQDYRLELPHILDCSGPIRVTPLLIVLLYILSWYVSIVSNTKSAIASIWRIVTFFYH